MNDIKQLKTFIFENNKIQDILEQIDCHSIKYHQNGQKSYWSCGNYNGDNKAAIILYNNENLNCINYTRDIGTPSDLISLVCYNKQLSFFEALKLICNIIGIDYYYDFDADIPESLKITKLIYEMKSSCENINEDDNDKPLKLISEKILSYYKPYVNDMFYNDNIDYLTQQEFEIGYDQETNRITIPVRDEIGSLIGIHARLFKKEIKEYEKKYLYIETCNKSKILYGLFKTYPYIKQLGKCYIVEPPKGVMQLWSMGIYNSVSTFGKKISQQQIEKLTRLGVNLVFCYDKDVTKKEIENIADRFVDGVNINYLWDDKDLLEGKESPSDKGKEIWNKLINECMYKIK